MLLKRFILIATILTTSLLASESFWQKLVEVEDTYFSRTTILELIKKDNNTTAIYDKNETSSSLDEQFKSFALLISLLKNDPYSLDINKTLFVDSTQIDKEINQLTLRIDNNKKYGYKQAIQRDIIGLR